LGGLVLYEEGKTFSSLDQNSKLLETMNSKQKSRLNLVKIQRVCPRGVRADPGIHHRLSALSPPWRKTFGDYIFSGIIKKRKKKQRKIARGIFRSLAPLLGLGNCRLSLGLWYRADDTGT